MGGRTSRKQRGEATATRTWQGYTRFWARPSGWGGRQARLTQETTHPSEQHFLKPGLLWVSYGSALSTEKRRTVYGQFRIHLEARWQSACLPVVPRTPAGPRSAQPLVMCARRTPHELCRPGQPEPPLH